MANRATKYNGTTVSVKKFLKCFDETATFIVLTDQESEEDGDYTTGANTNIVFIIPENFLLAVNHAKIPNTTYRKVQGFPPSAEIMVTGHIYRANKVHLKEPTPFLEAPFLNDPKFFRYIIYDHRGAHYLIKNDITLPKTFMNHLLRKDETLVALMSKSSSDEITALIEDNPYRIKYFPEDPAHQIQAVSKEPYTLQYIKSPSEELIEIALKCNGTAIRFVEDPTPEQYELAITQTYMAIQHIPKSKRTKALLTLTQTLLEADLKTNIDFESLVK